MLLLAVWVKANTAPVCFEGMGDRPGVFRSPNTGKLAAVSLVHLYGYVRCAVDSDTYWSFWGCANHHYLKNYVDVIITTSGPENEILLPPSEFMTASYYGPGKWSLIPGYNPNSPSLVMSSFTSNTTGVSSPLQDVREGDELRVWYGEDLTDWYETDNDGEVCCDVFTLII